MGLIDSIIGVESGGNPNARNPRSSASGLLCANAASLPSVDVRNKFRTHVLVGELLFPGRPSAVLWRIISVSIRETVKGMIRAWSRPHICKEIFKAVPALANFNALRTVVLVRNMVGEGASASHAVPDLILGRCLAAPLDRNRHAVSFGASPGLNQTAAATSGVARSKIGDRDNLLCAAIAGAKHASDCCAAVLSDLWLSLRNRGELSELRSDAVYRGCH